MKRLLVLSLAVACTGPATEPLVTAGPTVPIAGAYRLVSLNDRAIPTTRGYPYWFVDSAGLVVTETGAWTQIEFAHATNVGTWAAYWGGYVDRIENALTLSDSTRTLKHYTGTADDTSIVLVDRGANRWRYVRAANAPQPGAYFNQKWARRRDGFNRQP